jgi:hypothetical protein
MNDSAKKALLLTVGVLGAGALLNAAGIGLGALLWATAAATAVVMVVLYARRGIGALSDRLREHAWRKEEGHFHAFAGVPLQVTDDGRYVWLGGPGLLRVLGRKEPDDVLASRMPGQWRRADDGSLLLRVDAVVAYLASMPGRDEPRMQKLRRYLERDVLYPAAERRRRT